MTYPLPSPDISAKEFRRFCFETSAYKADPLPDTIRTVVAICHLLLVLRIAFLWLVLLAVRISSTTPPVLPTGPMAPPTAVAVLASSSASSSWLLAAAHPFNSNP